MAISTTQVNDSATTVYTSSNNSAVTYVTFTNYTASAVAVDINVVPSGDSVGNVNLVADSLEIAANDTYQLYASGEKLLLENGDFISATANTATAINCVVSYTAI
jgi:hypothetical protein